MIFFYLCPWFRQADTFAFVVSCHYNNILVIDIMILKHPVIFMRHGWLCIVTHKIKSSQCKNNFTFSISMIWGWLLNYVTCLQVLTRTTVRCSTVSTLLVYLWCSLSPLLMSTQHLLLLLLSLSLDPILIVSLNQVGRRSGTQLEFFSFEPFFS